ncbi:uncharacterized protein LOC130047013 [Ostrea edulis]|uniref:uncharacterized protein LOC130047013 n=1 Tax=Ostrea edulis TaxID=37623 RepID=UPI0024AEBCF4|nr:uncharacterized protein LOC130047013 [Ostrea edulis]
MVTFPGQLPGLGGTTNSNFPVLSAIDLQRRSQELLSYSISDNTRKLYDTALNVFNTFRKAYYHEEKWPPHSHELVNFVWYLSYKQFSPNTIKSYISGLSYFCKLHNVHDSTQSFLLRKVLVGLTRKNPRAHDRKPLTLDILSSILRLLPTICKSPYESALFSAIFTTAFFEYFRMGELVQNSVHDPGRAIQARDVIYLEHNNTVPIFLRHSKTDQVGKRISSWISPLHANIPIVTAENISAPGTAYGQGGYFGSPVALNSLFSYLTLCLND